MCTLKVHKGVIDVIDKAKKVVFMRGNSAERKGGNLTAREMVQKSKDKGGLGVINLKLQNDDVLMKQLHKFYIKVDVPWVKLVWTTYYQNKIPHAAREVGSFWWKDILR
jgi:hypothetical protein